MCNMNIQVCYRGAGARAALLGDLLMPHILGYQRILWQKLVPLILVVLRKARLLEGIQLRKLAEETYR